LKALPQPHDAEHLAAEMHGVARDTIGFGMRIGVRHDRLPAAKRLRGAGLRRGSGRHLDFQLGLEIGDHLLRIGIAAGEIDRYAAEHQESELS
jgi:hypothetical protein